MYVYKTWIIALREFSYAQLPWICWALTDHWDGLTAACCSYKHYIWFRTDRPLPGAGPVSSTRGLYRTIIIIAIYATHAIHIIGYWEGSWFIKRKWTSSIHVHKMMNFNRTTFKVFGNIFTRNYFALLLFNINGLNIVQIRVPLGMLPWMSGIVLCLLQAMRLVFRNS